MAPSALATLTATVLFLVFAASTAGTSLPATHISLTEARYAWIHVGRPGRSHLLQASFAHNVSHLTFAPDEYALTATVDSELMYFGNVPLRVQYAYSVVNTLALGDASARAALA